MRRRHSSCTDRTRRCETPARHTPHPSSFRCCSLCARSLFGWVPPLIYFLYRSPLRTFGGILFYYLVLSRLPIWKRLVARFAQAGIDPRFHLIKHVDLDLENKRYLICIHPHVRLLRCTKTTAQRESEIVRSCPGGSLTFLCSVSMCVTLRACTWTAFSTRWCSKRSVSSRCSKV